MTREEWRPIPGAAGYEASSLGRIRSSKSGSWRIKKPTMHTTGYLYVGLWIEGKQRSVKVHRLVGDAFFGPKPAGLVTRHLDGTRTNNVVENLRYGTWSENHLDAVAHGTHWQTAKTHCKHGHPFDEVNTGRTGRRRYCFTCARQSGAKYRANRRLARAG